MRNGGISRVTGHGGERSRVGGMVVSREFFASGRYKIVMKIGGTKALPGGPEDPRRPIGAVPAVWTYGYRHVALPEGLDPNSFHPEHPLYNPHMKRDERANEYWSEIDFPEFGKDGNFDLALYNTLLQTRHQSRVFDVAAMIDGAYHTLTTEWRSALLPLPGVGDAQVIEHGGFHWVHDKEVSFNSYLGNPLKKLGPDEYAVHAGTLASHYLDGRKVGENPTFVPSMAAQLSFGVWLPGWGGPAPWSRSRVTFASARVWQYHDEGDVRDVIHAHIIHNF